ncbi:MAG TPA: FG-GAP repeat protein [Methylomirabilota bacterium]|nr:FG-GAP repeat protein [Methylomirabilota bacterium]
MEQYGGSIAVLNTHTLIIGAPNANNAITVGGAVYLVTTNGTPVTAIGNPALPRSGNDRFGHAVAALGLDRLVIGAPGTFGLLGTAYSCGTKGTMFLQYTNPAPSVQGLFGRSVAVLGNNHVVIGAPAHSSDGGSGRVYLYDATSGALLRTFTNGGTFGFGFALATLDNDRFVVRTLGSESPVRSALLFHVDGTLLTTFTNAGPTASGILGASVAAVGADKVLISNASSGGPSAYLCETNGNLLGTFRAPLSSVRRLGRSITALGTNRVVLAGKSDSGGGVFTYALDGTLLAELIQPRPHYEDDFGSAVAALGEDRVVVGAINRAGNYPNSGEAYLFHAGPQTPALTLARSTVFLCGPDVYCSDVTITWPAPATGFVLEKTSQFQHVAGQGFWQSVHPGSYFSNDTHYQYHVPDTSGTNLYRLRKP